MYNVDLIHSYQKEEPQGDQHLLHSHLGHNIKGAKVGVGEVVFVLAHFDGVQPLIHVAEAGEVWDTAVQEWEVDTGKDKRHKNPDPS